MRPSTLIPLIALASFAAGCTLNDFDDRHQREVNVWMTQTMHNAAGENAVILQHTLYPYHFVVNSSELTPLGQKTLRTLAGHYRQHPGPLNVRKGDASVALYMSRVENVKQTLEDSGVDSSLVPIRDASPGGDGVWSEDVLTMRRAAAQSAAEGSSTDSTSDSAARSASTGVRRDSR